jgi:hypothetical protein
MAWDDRIIGREIAAWDGRLPKRNVFTITKIHPSSVAQAAGVEPGQYCCLEWDGRAGNFWTGLAVRGAEGEVVSRIFDADRKQCMALRTRGFPWGMRLQAPHFKLCVDLRRALPQPEEYADRIMNAPEPQFRELTEAALRGLTLPHPKRLLLYHLRWLYSGQAEANLDIDEMRVPAATGAIAKGNVARARWLLPKPTRNLLVAHGTAFAALYCYTAGLIAAKSGGERQEAANLLHAAHESLPDCERIRDALRDLGEPVPSRTRRAGQAFPIDYRLPVVDPRLALPGLDCRTLVLSEELARLRPDQIALVVVVGGYRTNGFYSKAMEMLGHLYPLIADRLGFVHVITSRLRFSDADRTFTERWMRGESYALKRGVPLVVLTDGEDKVAGGLDITHSPSNYLLGPDGRVLVEGRLDDDGPIWDALAKLDAQNPAA